MSTVDTDLQYTINHIFLPPRLPQKDDDNVKNNVALSKRVLAALQALQAYVPEQQNLEWAPYIQMVKNIIELRDEAGYLMPQAIERRLGEMSDGGMGASSH